MFCIFSKVGCLDATIKPKTEKLNREIIIAGYSVILTRGIHSLLREMYTLPFSGQQRRFYNGSKFVLISRPPEARQSRDQPVESESKPKPMEERNESGPAEVQVWVNTKMNVGKEGVKTNSTGRKSQTRTNNEARLSQGHNRVMRKNNRGKTETRTKLSKD